MNVNTTFGDFRIIQSMSKNDELLILSRWDSLVSLFDSSRVFLVNKRKNVFGVYLCKQECSELLSKMLKNVDYYDTDALYVNKEIFFDSIRV